MKQSILGSGGAIGVELVKELSRYTSEIRLVSRNPKKINSTDELFQADLSVREHVFQSVEGSEIVYLTVGFDYNTKLWQQKWVPLIKNVIDACKQYKAKLVFFDNVYAIGGDNVRHITESSPISPTSKKGEVRAEVDKQIIENVEKGNIEAIIARAPDFFGPVKTKSLLMHLVYDNFAKGKSAQWFCSLDVVHTIGYTTELAKGTAILGNTKEAYNQIWNLPVDPTPITARQWVELFASEMNVKNRVQVLPRWGVKLIGLFVPILKEMYEMLYQYDRDYYFDSSKFNNYFNYKPTKNLKAVQETISQLNKNEFTK